MHAMDGQSGDGAREGETLGKGGSHPESEALGTGGSHPESETSGRGGSDAHSDKSDGRCSAFGGSLPSNAATEASGIEGDPNVVDIGGDEGPMRYEQYMEQYRARPEVKAKQAEYKKRHFETAEGAE